MKTLDETKEDLEVWGVGVLVDDGYGNFRPPGIWQGNAAEVCRNALACIQTLESTYSQVSKSLVGKKNATLEELLQAVDQLKTNIAQVERERDAAVRDCARFPCSTCDDKENGDLCHNCNVRKDTTRTNYEWRGICEENMGKSK